MKSIIDRHKIASRARLSHIASIGGLAVLLASVVLPMFRQDLASISSPLMIIGLATSMVGIYFANRWVKKPRPEDGLDKALKGLSDHHRLYHYPALPCDHLLLAPDGVIVLETVNLSGRFSYKGGRWKEKMTIGRALRSIVEERLGDPVKAARAAENHLKKLFDEQIAPGANIPVNSLVVFTHPAVELEIENPPLPVCKLDKLRRHIPNKPERLPPEVYEQLRQFLENKTIP